jgi:hypothetical protein
MPFPLRALMKVAEGLDAQLSWLRFSVTSRKVVGSVPDKGIGFLEDEVTLRLTVSQYVEVSSPLWDL